MISSKLVSVDDACCIVGLAGCNSCQWFRQTTRYWAFSISSEQQMGGHVLAAILDAVS
jgi:hypothetical protein